MFALVHLKDQNDQFILYSEKDIPFEGSNLELEKELSFSDIETEHFDIPLYPLEDFILASLSKKKTKSGKLNDENISNYIELLQEYQLIQEKKSKLSRSKRDLVVSTFNRLHNE